MKKNPFTHLNIFGMQSQETFLSFIKDYLVLRKYMNEYAKFKESNTLSKVNRIAARLDNKAFQICIDENIPLTEPNTQSKLF